MTLENIIRLFRDTADKHLKINGFYTGMKHEHNNSSIQYPALRVNFPYNVSPNVDNDLLTYTFKLTLLVNETSIETSNLSYEINTNVSNQQNTLNEIDADLVNENLMRENALKITAQYIQGLYMAETSFDFLKIVGYRLTSLERYANDMVTGVECDITIQCNNPYKCEAENNADYQVWKDDTNGNFNQNPIEQCVVISFPTDCNEILANLTDDLMRNCVIPSVDYSINENFDALTPTQISDLEDRILPSGCTEIYNFVEPYLSGCVIPQIPFSDINNLNALTPTQLDDIDEFINPTTQYSMLFDGVNEYCIVSNKINYNFTNITPFSISTWVKSVWSRDQVVCGKRIVTGAFTGYTVFANSLGGMRFVLRGTAPNNGIIVEANAPANNVWTHICVTYDGSQSSAGAKIYYNGVQQNTISVENSLSTSIATNGDFEIGRAGTAPFLGNIGITRVWNVELSSAQVLSDYNGGIMLNEPILSANNVIDFTSGTNALYTGTNWFFPDSTLINSQLTYRSTNMEFADRTTDIPT